MEVIRLSWKLIIRRNRAAIDLITENYVHGIIEGQKRMHDTTMSLDIACSLYPGSDNGDSVTRLANY